MRYFIELSYDGTNYHGWQRQPRVSSVQQTMEEALTTILQTKTVVTGCGRTDAGVHAKQFFGHFDFSGNLDIQLITHKLNTVLPHDIGIFNLFEVDDEANCRFDAIERVYIYRVHQVKDPFLFDRSYFYKPEMDIVSMNNAASYLLTVNDFESFCKAKAQNHTNICDVREAVWTINGSELVFKIRADRFLRNMVRAIVGTLIEVGIGKMSQVEFKHIVDSKDRSAAGRSVPACGLYLDQVTYPENIVKLR